VTVAETAGVTGTDPANPVLTVTFNNTGAETLITPNFLLTVANNTSGSQDVQTISFPANTSLSPTEVSNGNFVGSIVDPLRPNTTTFAYTIPSTITATKFVFGDTPIDGLIAAIDLTSFKNFVPEAYITEDASGNAFLVDSVNS
jgi:hypothetical protein